MVRPKDKPEKTDAIKAALPRAPPPAIKQREQRTKAVRVVKVCPKCGAFMIPTAHFAREGETAAFTADNRLRSFGGVEVRTFECEKCHHTTQFQIDPFPKDIGDE